MEAPFLWNPVGLSSGEEVMTNAFFLRFFPFRKLEKKFDLYYYDGLARQDEEIRLTVGKELQQHYLEL